MIKPLRPLALTIAIALTTACATAPAPLRGAFSEVPPGSNAVAPGQPVRWGGTIIATEPRSDRTCFEVLARPLSETARPLAQDRAEGRFMACNRGFYDPALFSEGREITFTGTVSGFETRRIGQYDYRYPVIDADVIYLWPPRRDIEYVYVPDPWLRWDPWWGYRAYYPPIVRRRP